MELTCFQGYAMGLQLIRDYQIFVMNYHIRLSHPIRTHFESQRATHQQLCQAGFINLHWAMGTGKSNGDSIHGWNVEGNEENLLVLKLSADVISVTEFCKDSSKVEHQ